MLNNEINTILNNKFNIMFNYEKIDADFDIFMVYKEKGHFFKSNILDIPNTKLNARSVVYTRGNKWYAMFDKKKISLDFLKEILVEEDDEIFITQIDIMEENYIPSNVLAQLLFNILNAPKINPLKYNNISGKLLYIQPNWMKNMKRNFYGLELTLNEELFLKMQVQTFSPISKEYANKYFPHYIFDSTSGRFRRKFKNEMVTEQIFVPRNFSKKKNKIDFLNFSSHAKFCDSKVGVLKIFMDDIKQELSDYMTISNGGYSSYSSISPKEIEIENKNHKDILLNRNICIIDEVKTEESYNFCLILQNDFKKYYNIDCCIQSSLDIEAYNIRLIRNKQYYVDNNIADPYKNSYHNYIIQHITLDDFELKENKESSSMKKIIQELIIKNDLKTGNLSIVNWSKNDYLNDWNFVKRTPFYDQDNKKEHIYYKMTVTPLGKFSFASYNSQQFTTNKEWNAIEQVYENYVRNAKQIEGLVYTTLDNIHIISTTDQYTIPNYDALSRALELSDKNNMVDVKMLIDYAKQYLIDNTTYLEQATAFLNQLEHLGLECRNAEVLKILNIRTSFAKEFNQYFYQNTGVLLHATVKDESVRDKYFNAILDIKYFFSDDSLYYFVGTAAKNLQTSLHNACLVRKINSIGKDIISFDIMKLMAVEFVRNGQYTVTPFPFKYLNEYINIIEKNINSK